ncbi:MAG: hypothetical protein ACTHMS_05750 [Jatrophihabitans sp.]|uniref:hypothetical protein n=1 Tax=Jatrophihabitans sp. TaxID=1932789 RepID=UPI003F81ACD9
MSDPTHSTGEGPEAVVVAVPDDAVDELVGNGLASEIPTLRGPVLDAVLTVGVDSAALVTLLQTPDTLRTFAAWVRQRATAHRDEIRISARREGRVVELQVRGDVPVDTVATFLSDALAPKPASDAEPAPGDA